jgi:hypothetical protein
MAAPAEIFLAKLRNGKLDLPFVPTLGTYEATGERMIRSTKQRDVKVRPGDKLFVLSAIVTFVTEDKVTLEYTAKTGRDVIVRVYPRTLDETYKLVEATNPVNLDELVQEVVFNLHKDRERAARTRMVLKMQYYAEPLFQLVKHIAEGKRISPHYRHEIKEFFELLSQDQPQPPTAP